MSEVEVYFIGGPLDLTKSIELLPSDGRVRVAHRGPVPSFGTGRIPDAITVETTTYRFRLVGHNPETRREIFAAVLEAFPIGRA